MALNVMCRGIVCTCLLIILVPFSGLAEMTKDEINSLKAASLNCEVEAFSNYMPDETRIKVVNAANKMEKIRNIRDSIYTKSVNMFGDGVIKNKTGIQIPISGQDYRWANVFGPQWDEMVNTYPDGPFYFNINAYFAWEQECDVVRRFQACLEDNSFCSDYHIEGSVLRVTKVENSWNLLFDLPPQSTQQAEKITSLVINLSLWVDEYLDEHKDTYPNEDFKYQFASDYFMAMKEITQLMQ